MAIVIVGVVLFGVVSYVLFMSNKEQLSQSQDISSQSQAIPQVKAELKTTGLPARLIIPKLSVDAKILYMGLTPDGDMDVAGNNFRDVGWYQYGSRPGNSGTAVIAGHVNGAHERGVFIDLHKLLKGDIVKILDDKDQTITFAVSDIRTYDQEARPEQVFQSSEGTHLNLITCAGQWNVAEHRFPERLVVFADKVTL